MLQLNAHGTARYLLAREISRAGYKTVMAGEGGDEAFAGYAFLRAAMPSAPGADAASGGLVGGAAGPLGGRLPASVVFGLRLLRPATPAQRQLAAVSPWLARVTRGLGLRGPAVDTLAARLSVVREVLAPGFLDRYRDHDPYRGLYRSLDARDHLRAWEPARAMLYLWLRTLFAGYHLAADRLDMAHAVEVRMPFLDHVLWEHLCRYPVTLLARDGQNKYLLREAVRPAIPDAVYRRTKQPFLAPPAAATPGNPLHDFVQDTLRGSSLAFVDHGAVVRLLDGLPARPAAELQSLEALLMALVSLTILDRTSFGGPVA
jgi:asparagine synthase (glutamine-hydrolysing)